MIFFWGILETFQKINFYFRIMIWMHPSGYVLRYVITKFDFLLLSASELDRTFDNDSAVGFPKYEEMMSN